MPTRQGGSFLKKVLTLQLPTDEEAATCVDAMNLKD